MTLSEYDIVAITEDIATHHQTTGALLTLKKGQVGTVLMTFDSQTKATKTGAEAVHEYCEPFYLLGAPLEYVARLALSE